MSILIEGRTGTDDSGAWIYEKDVLGSSPRDGAGKSGASGSVDWAKISLAARRRLGRREERLAFSVILLLFRVAAVGVLSVPWYCEEERVRGASGRGAGGVTVVEAKFWRVSSTTSVSQWINQPLL
ncbi:hypothetical protein OG21DRAFT_300285 [Imleria badia]|nr:hypothetical protein OG21DRAFT_300285 [Imleria badia]